MSLFRQAIAAGADQTEMYYWTQIEKNSAVAPRLVNELATYYKRKRNYDKAYLFYREFLQYHSEDVPALVSCAEMEMMRGKEKDAVKTYEKVLSWMPIICKPIFSWGVIITCKQNAKRRSWRMIIRK